MRCEAQHPKFAPEPVEEDIVMISRPRECYSLAAKVPLPLSALSCCFGMTTWLEGAAHLESRWVEVQAN